ncbi:hypothetical protein JZO73_10695 [Enterococcus plantarum]|uniref:hypothetical protein n=1 Tax=Enterococcus plantarum TaxID=1077675 RepID=UPI001A8EF773|nr:hypothetical protein [Enterococcus plantarum]MBO0467996.1 hypothetical protein [Enterococcus plantarum]
MDKFDEKELIYQQMNLLMKERSELTKSYNALKDRLFNLDFELDKDYMMKQKSAKIPKSEIENQKYLLAKKEGIKRNQSYQKISLTIASILKEANVPLSNKEIYRILTKEHQLTISYPNFTNNILPRIKEDSSIHVERAYRGYWQYRLT